MIDRSFKVLESKARGVLLIHGMTGAPGEMKPLAKRLIRRGFSVACPQLAGHGADQKTLLSTGWRDWLETVIAAYDALAAEVDQVSVAGICAGGALGLLLSRERPKLRAAAVYSMTFEYDGWNMPGWAAAAPLLQLVANLPAVRQISFAEPSPFGLKDERLRQLAETSPESLIEGALPRMPLGALYQLYRLGRQIERVGSEITIPTLILHAREDDMSHPRNAGRLKAALGGETDLRLLEDSFHMIHVDKERDVVADMTAHFFADHAEIDRGETVDA